MKPVDVKSGKYINFNKENDKEDAKSEFGEHVRISEFKNSIAKSCVPNEDALWLRYCAVDICYYWS